MKQKAWRLIQSPYQAQAFSGEGARLYGGRWNSKGTALIYTASNLALAAMELMAHLPSSRLLLQRYVYFSITFDTKLCTRLPPKKRPQQWRDFPAPSSTQRIGDQWTQKQSSLILEVPSVIIPEEHNYLINPNHPDFSKLSISPPQEFHFDPRLLNE